MTTATPPAVSEKDPAISLEPAAQDVERNMAAAGVPIADSGEVDYFGFDETDKVFLPDGKQYLEIRALNEGGRTKFQAKTNRDVIVARTTGDAKMRLDPGSERHALLMEAIVGWSLRRKDPKKGDFYDVPFNKQFLGEFLENADPKIINIIEKEVRKLNPWTMNEMTVEDIDKELADLQELREAKVKEDAGNSNSSGK